MDYDKLIERAKYLAEKNPLDTLSQGFMFLLKENKRLQEENNQQWHKLNPEGMGR